MAVLLDAVGALVGAVQPRHLTMETYYGGLPAKALDKYSLISRLLQSRGYRLQDQFRAPDTGIDYWLFLKVHIEPATPNH